MGAETRESERFDDIGRIEAPELCPLAGVLDNVSKGGIKVHYSVPVVVDLENDYEIELTLARSASQVIELIVHPQWAREKNGITEIGFKILPSKGIAQLVEYIEELDLENDSGIEDQIANFGCQMI